MNPKNWPTSKKTRVTLLLGLITMCSGLSSAIFASTTGTLAKEYGVSDEVMILGSSLYMLGVPGPIIFAPLSEVFGRRTVLVPVFFFICFTAATATAENLQTIFITRFFSGLFASAPVTTVGGALGDLFDQRERGWRWTMYLVLILTSVAVSKSLASLLGFDHGGAQAHAIASSAPETVEAALPFLAILVGTLIAALLNLLYSLLVYQPYLDKHGNQAQPEMRLPPMMVGGVLFPLAFFLLGWTDPVGQMFGCMFAGVAFLMIFQAGINFFIDTYTVYAASAVASNTFVRSIASALFGNLGIGWGCSLLGFLALLCTVIPFAFYRFGPKLRDMSRFAASAS
ncbi:major facilitator superfamily domain-containing protein [Pseudohyphozyma bogoriensis]|nr:major facilitator superfamily domain-containing protein [Pseudohyphozyma bogoriensis]